MKLFTFCLLAALLFFSCKKQDNAADSGNSNNNNNILQKGVITGKVVTPNNKTAVRNAIVFIADSGKIYSTFTDVNGSFSLEAPAGQRVINIQSGTGKIFRTTLNVTIEAQKTTAIATGAVQLNQVASLAYVYGSFDKIQSIL